MREIGRQSRSEALEIFTRNVTSRRVGPHGRNAVLEIRRGLTNRARSHQRMTGRAVLAAPGQRLRTCGLLRGGLKLLRSAAWRQGRALPAILDRPGEKVVKETLDAVAIRCLGARLAWRHKHCKR